MKFLFLSTAERIWGGGRRGGVSERCRQLQLSVETGYLFYTLCFYYVRGLVRAVFEVRKLHANGLFKALLTGLGDIRVSAFIKCLLSTLQ